jgi:D-alanyl-D-alanine carboxypeptidase/D-alanyl-D-alanine-endopeptidase (penicillin-binding protein 4)
VVAVVIAGLTMPLTVLAVPAAQAAQPSDPANPAEVQLVRKVQQRTSNAALGPDVSIVIIDEASNRLVMSQRPRARQLPASNMKVMTAVLALATLGPNHRFTTRVVAGNRPNEIFLQAGGDPLLTKRNLRWLAQAVAPDLRRSRPVVLRVDDRIFTGSGQGPGWPDHYLGSVAGPVRALALLKDRSRSRQERAVEVFRAALQRKGFRVLVRSDRRAPADARVLAQIAPHTVRRAVAVMLNESENNVAEVLFRQVAIASGQPATWAGGRRAATSLLRGLGIDTTGLRLMDGSGLSRGNRVTALALAQVARLSRVDPRFTAMYGPRAMPIAGRSGTLDDRYGRYTTKPSRCARGKIRAKTGTLFDTIGLTGVTTARDGQEKAFAILVNHRPQRVSRLTTRRAVDALAATINGCW